MTDIWLFAYTYNVWVCMCAYNQCIWKHTHSEYEEMYRHVHQAWPDASYAVLCVSVLIPISHTDPLVRSGKWIRVAYWYKHSDKSKLSRVRFMALAGLAWEMQSPRTGGTTRALYCDSWLVILMLFQLSQPGEAWLHADINQMGHLRSRISLCDNIDYCQCAFIPISHTDPLARSD
jgi:hypothetical protein